jgi:hypothetical protein
MRVDMVDSKMMTVIEKQIADLATTVHAHLVKCSGLGFQQQSQAETGITPEQIKCNTCKNEISKKKKTKTATCGKCKEVSHWSCSTNEDGNFVCLKCENDPANNFSTDIKNISTDISGNNASADNPANLDGIFSTK